MRDAAEPACPAVRSVAQMICRVDIAVPSYQRLTWRIQVKSALTAAGRFLAESGGANQACKRIGQDC
jgi:hypothetical protein